MSQHPHCSYSVLVIDDDPDALELVSALVRRADPMAHVIAKNSGRAALRYLRRVQAQPGKGVPLPALILLDLRMPIINGFQILRWVKRQPFLRGVRVVVLSASDVDVAIKRAMGFGADGFLIKYPNPACFASLMRHAVASGAERNATIAAG